MIEIRDNIYATIDNYVNYLINEGATSQKRAYEKRDLMIQALNFNLGGMVRYRLSPYKELGRKEGCLLYVYRDPKSKTQWGFAYEEFDDNNVIVHYMRNLKLVK